jgi:hypothetical protein
MGPTPSDLLGAIICLIAIFLPGFLLLLGALPFWDSFRKRPTAQAAAGPPFLSGNKVSPSISFRPLGVRPKQQKELGQWLPSAPSPPPKTGSPARSARSPSTSRPASPASKLLRQGPRFRIYGNVELGVA